MNPWVKLDAARTPSGGEMTLMQRGQDFVIRVDRQDLMGSRMHGSEESLASLGCEGLAGRGARVLVGGLGMGFTVRAALDVLGQGAAVEVAELIPAVVAWNRGPLAHLAGRPLDDPRAIVREEDVVDVIAGASDRYDAILLDVDNGPDALTSPGNARLYGPAGLARATRALRAGGTLAVWSAEDDRRFTAKLERAGFDTRMVRVAARQGAGRRHAIWLARRPARAPR